MKNTCRVPRCLLLAPLVLTAHLLPESAYAQETTPDAVTAIAADIVNDADKFFNWTGPETPGGSVAIMYKGKLILNRAYGSADLERDVPISPATIFDAASVTKQFVAAAVLLLVEDDRLSLSEDIRKYIPELPDTGHKITLDHLMTHTSGIRDWTGILPLAAGDPDALTVVLRQRGLNFAPGDEWSYSNSGYVLLKEIVARTSGMSFAEFANKRLFEPLGMKSTQYLLDLREIVKNRALAYDKEDGRWKLDMKLDNDRGGGGALLSTPTDLLLWNEALTNGRLGDFVTGRLHEPATLSSGRKVGYGRGLFLHTYRGAKEVWHSGGSAGYGTWLGRYPEQGLSVAIMCNADAIPDKAGLAHRIFDRLVPGAPAAEPGDGPPPAIPDDLLEAVTERAGLFLNEQSGETMRLAVDRGRFRIAAGPGLVTVDKDRFKRWGASLMFMSQDAFELQFLSNDEFQLKSMEGATTKYRRAQPYTPTPDDLKTFAGRYNSDEVGSAFRIEPRGAGLAINLEHSPEKSIEFKAVDKDTFQFNRVSVRFLRDNNGKVESLDYSNPVLRRVKFTKSP